MELKKFEMINKVEDEIEKDKEIAKDKALKMKKDGETQAKEIANNIINKVLEEKKAMLLEEQNKVNLKIKEAEQKAEIEACEIINNSKNKKNKAIDYIISKIIDWIYKDLI